MKHLQINILKIIFQDIKKVTGDKIISRLLLIQIQIRSTEPNLMF